MTEHLTNDAFRWLTLERNCITVLTERSPRWGHGQPDVLGVTKNRYLVEIEVKVSMADFRNNAKKAHVIRRNVKQWPKHFWFLVPDAMVEKCLPELPEWAGLLRSYRGIQEVKPAPVNPESKRLSVKEVAVLFRKQTLQLMSDRQAGIYAEIYRREPEYQI